MHCYRNGVVCSWKKNTVRNANAHKNYIQKKKYHKIKNIADFIKLCKTKQQHEIVCMVWYSNECVNRTKIENLMELYENISKASYQIQLANVFILFVLNFAPEQTIFVQFKMRRTMCACLNATVLMIRKIKFR